MKYCRHSCITAIFVLLIVPGYAQVCASQIIRNHFSFGSFLPLTSSSTERVSQPELLAEFYSRNGYELSWFNRKNSMDLYTAIQLAADEGLNPDDYHFKTLKTYFFKGNLNEFDLAYFDLLLTDAFFTYSSHLFFGKIDPELIYPGKWEKDDRRINLVLLLENALATGTIASTLDELKPHYEQYLLLKEQLTKFRKIQSSGTWPVIPDGDLLFPGDSSERISIIKSRLIRSGLLSEPVLPSGNVYDSLLRIAILKFQKQHGLVNDGVIGAETLHALNLSAADYIDRIRINLERLRWLSRACCNTGVVINIPDYRLWVKTRDSLQFSMKVIVGRPDRSTPVFSSIIRYLTINPTWTVPPTILKEDVLPAVQKDINYLAKKNLHIINRKGEEIDPKTLDWTRITAKKFPYQIQQEPGPDNSMGLIKFQFPNRFGVFLHDTNARYLFAESYRALSSGCVRIEQPFILAEYLLKDSRWSKAKLEKEVLAKKTTTILFDKPIPVYILYLTVFVDEQNILQCRNDIYLLDDPLLCSLGATVK